MSDEAAKTIDEPAKTSDEPAKTSDEPAKTSDEAAKTIDEPAKVSDATLSVLPEGDTARNTAAIDTREPPAEDPSIAEAEYRREIDALKTQIAQQGEEIKNSKQMLDERAATIENQSQRIAELERDVAAKEVLVTQQCADLAVKLATIAELMAELESMRPPPSRPVTCTVFALPDLRPSAESDLDALRRAFAAWALPNRGLDVTYTSNSPTRVGVFAASSRALPDPNALNVCVSMTKSLVPANGALVIKKDGYTVNSDAQDTIAGFTKLADKIDREQPVTHCPTLQGCRDDGRYTRF